MALVNEVKNEHKYNVSIGQAKEGSGHVWICKDISVRTDDPRDLADLFDSLVTKVKAQVGLLNEQ